MEEKKEKKQIKTTLEVAIFIAILIIGIIISTVFIIMNKNKNNQSKLTSNNTENKIEENQVETSIENTAVESELKDIQQELYQDAQEALKETQKAQETEEEALKEAEKLAQELLNNEKQEEIKEEIKQDVTTNEVSSSNDKYVLNMFLSYPSDWEVINNEYSSKIRAKDNEESYIMILEEQYVDSDMDLAYLENWYEENTPERKIIKGWTWLAVYMPDESAKVMDLFTIKNNYLYTVEVVIKDNINQEIINKIVDSMQIPEG